MAVVQFNSVPAHPAPRLDWPCLYQGCMRCAIIRVSPPCSQVGLALLALIVVILALKKSPLQCQATRLDRPCTHLAVVQLLKLLYFLESENMFWMYGFTYKELFILFCLITSKMCIVHWTRIIIYKLIKLQTHFYFNFCIRNNYKNDMNTSYWLLLMKMKAHSIPGSQYFIIELYFIINYIQFNLFWLYAYIYIIQIQIYLNVYLLLISEMQIEVLT
jgi:hypothetical protein